MTHFIKAESLPRGAYSSCTVYDHTPVCTQTHTRTRTRTHTHTHTQSGIPHVSADVELLKFGYCSPKQTSESKVHVPL